MSENEAAAWRGLVLFGKDLDPAPIRVFDEVEAHGGVVVDDAAHFVMQLARGLHIGDAEGQVRVFAAVVVGLGAAFVPGELKLEGGRVVRGEDDDPGAIIGAEAARFGHAERLFVEREGLVEIEHVRAAMDAFSFDGHDAFFLVRVAGLRGCGCEPIELIAPVALVAPNA